ncbi:MAG: hypothetical protein QXJ02_01995 [Candidatus Bathyarchaeia archaeon]
MKFYKKNLSILLMMLMMFLAIFTVFSFRTPGVKAAPLTIEVSSSSAPVGTTVTVSGTNATPNGEVGIYVAGFIFLGVTVADNAGNYSLNITSPAVPAGSYMIAAIDMESGDSATAPFTVMPRILLTLTLGACFEEIAIRGDGFQSGSNITISFNGIDVTPTETPQSDFLGSFKSKFRVPQVPNGNYTVTATDWMMNSASAEFTVVPKVNLWPQTSGLPSTLCIVNGYGYSASANLTAYFDTINITPHGVVQTSPQGAFSFPFFIPQVENGTYLVNVSDVNGVWAAAEYIVGSPVLTLTPERTSKLSVVTAKGKGFPMRGYILLYLEDITMTSLVDLMWGSDKLTVDNDGAFEYSFAVPIAEPGTYTVSAYLITGPSLSEPEKIASAPLTIVDDSPLSVALTVGSIHFAGEIAEFYATTSHNGRLVNATIERATLYYMEGASSQELTAETEQIALGVYRIPYAIPVVASAGTYTLVVEASYSGSSAECFGASSASFLVSETLTSQNAQIASIENCIATVIIPDLGVIKANLTAINARLDSINGTLTNIQTSIGTISTNIANIQLHVTSIEGSVATIQTMLGAIQGNVTAINGTVATIQTDLGTVQTDIGSLASEITPSGFEISAATLALALIAAVGAALTLLLMLRKKDTLTPEAPKPPSPPPPPSAPQTPST